MNKYLINRLELVEEEIRGCFDNWDNHINNHQQPVPIQDLDYWSSELKLVIANIKREVVLQ